MPKKKPQEPSECKTFSAELEVRMDITVVEGSVEKFWAKNHGIVKNILKDLLAAYIRKGTEKVYGDGMKLKIRVTEVTCMCVSEERKEW